MGLQSLKDTKNNVHLLYTTSSMGEMYVYDTLKEVYEANLDSIYTINSKSSFKNMLELINVQSYVSLKWIFVIDYSKVKSSIKQYKNILNSSTSCFLVKVKSYKEFKEFKAFYPRSNEIYLAVLQRKEIMFLLNGYSLSPKLVDFVISSYRRDPEKVFLLREKLDSGLNIEAQRDIVKLLGASAGSVNKFVMSLLNEPPKTKRGFNQVYQNRIQAAVDLSKAYGLSSFRNFMLATVRDILDIKTLYQQGVIFKSIRGLPEGYDEARLSRYNYYLPKIEDEIPYTRIVRLYCLLKESGRWYTKSDLLNFIYDFYGGVD